VTGSGKAQASSTVGFNIIDGPAGTQREGASGYSSNDRASRCRDAAARDQRDHAEFKKVMTPITVKRILDRSARLSA
jgi:hypothetical protein